MSAIVSCELTEFLVLLGFLTVLAIVGVLVYCIGMWAHHKWG